MWKSIQPVMPVLLGIILLEAGMGIIGAVMGIQLAARESASSFMIGIVFSAYYVGFLAGSLTCERLIDRVGHIRAFGVFAVSASISTLMLAIVSDIYAWALVKVLAGYCIAGAFVVIESWLNDKASEDNRGRIFAVYMVVSWGASGLSPLSLNVISPYSDLLFEISTILVAAAMIPLALTKVGNPEIGHRTSFSIVKLIRASPTGVACCFASGLLTGAFYSLLPVYIEQVGQSPRALSILIAVGTTAALITQYPIGYISDHYGRRPVIIGTMAIASAMALFIGSMPDLPFTWLLVAFFGLTAFQSPLYALGVGQTNDYVDRKDFVPAAAGLLFLWGVGACAGPTIAGFVMELTQPSGLFLYIGAGFAFVSLFALYRVFRRRAKTPKEQSDFVAVPNVQNVYGAPELDPRGEFHHHGPSPAAKDGFVE